MLKVLQANFIDADKECSHKYNEEDSFSVESIQTIENCFTTNIEQQWTLFGPRHNC